MACGRRRLRGGQRPHNQNGGRNGVCNTLAAATCVGPGITRWSVLRSDVTAQRTVERVAVGVVALHAGTTHGQRIAFQYAQRTRATDEPPVPRSGGITGARLPSESFFAIPAAEALEVHASIVTTSKQVSPAIADLDAAASSSDPDTVRALANGRGTSGSSGPVRVMGHACDVEAGRPPLP